MANPADRTTQREEGQACTRRQCKRTGKDGEAKVDGWLLTDDAMDLSQGRAAKRDGWSLRQFPANEIKQSPPARVSLRVERMAEARQLLTTLEAVSDS